MCVRVSVCVGREHCRTHLPSQSSQHVLTLYRKVLPPRAIDHRCDVRMGIPEENTYIAQEESIPDDRIIDSESTTETTEHAGAGTIITHYICSSSVERQTRWSVLTVSSGQQGKRSTHRAPF